MYSLHKNKAITIIGLLGIVTGIFVVISWIFQLPGIESFFPQYVSMRFNTAFCFLLAGGSLMLTQFQDKKYSASLFMVLSAAITLFAALSLSQNLFHYNAGIDQLFVTDYLAIAERYRFPGRMAPSVSLCFLLSGLALLGFRVKSRFANTLSQYLLHLITAVSGMAIVGYLYGSSVFYHLFFVASMAVNTAVLFFLVSIAASLLQPALGISNLFTGNLVGNRMARRLFILIVIMAITAGELLILSLRYHFISMATAVSIVAVGFVFVSLLVIWYTAKWLNRVNQKRYEAEEEIKVMNEELEERVEERSADLLKLLEKYQESESKFRAAFEDSAIGMALVSLQGEWIKVNRRLCEMLGYSEDELLSITFMDITYPDDVNLSFNTIGDIRANATDPYRIEKRYLCKNGSIIWASVNIAIVTDDKNAPLYLVSQIEDITERKKTDARFRTIVESVFVGIKLNAADGSIIYRSPSMRAINGWSDEEMGANYFGLAHPDDLEKIKTVHQEVLSNPGKSINIVYRILHKNGDYVWIESMICNKLSDPDLVAIITVTRDVTERKIAEDQLSKSEEKYHSLIEHASDAVYLLDFDGNFTDVNESMCKMTGYSKEELLSLNIEALIDPEQLKTDPLVHGPRNPDKATIRERRFVRKDGVLFEVEANVKLFAGDRILVIARDVTSRKHMEDVLREAELKFRTLAEKSMVGVYISQNERFIYVNPRFAEVFGYEPHELLNSAESGIDLIIYDEDQEIARHNIQARYKGQLENVHYEIRGKRKDGTVNYIEFYGSRVIIDGTPSIIGTMLDITDRKRAEELIIHEKTLSETIINSLPEVFYLRNVKGEFLRWNKNFEKVTGYTPDEIRTLNARDQMDEDDRGKIREAVERMAIEGHATVEARVISKYGVRIPFLITITPIIYGNEQCALGLAIDISERIKAEEELRSSEHKYKLLFESNPLPMLMMAKDDLSVIAANDAVARLYGYTKKEILEMDATKFRHPDDLPDQAEDWDKDITDGRRVIRHLKKDGTIMFVQIISHDIVFEGRPVRLAFTNDITEQVKAEETLKKSEANLKTIMDTTDTAYVLLDKNLTVMEYNPQAVKFVNSQFRQFPSTPGSLADYLPKERFSQFIRNADEVLKGHNISYEINYPQPDGSVFWYFVRLFPITNQKQEILGLMLALSDVTERKNAEESLKVAYKLVQEHIDSIKDMAWKQSHLIRSPVANLKGLVAMLEADPSDAEIQRFINIELERLDSIIIEMAEDASNHD